MLSQRKPATTATGTLATVVPAQNWLRCGYDGGGAWEALSSAGGKWRGGAFWELWPEEWAGTGSACPYVLRQWRALGNE